MRVTIKAIEAALREAFPGEDLPLHRGNGYFYVGGDAFGWYTASIYSCHLGHQTVAQWVEEIASLRMDAINDGWIPRPLRVDPDIAFGKGAKKSALECTISI